jgi:hypothetical protein
MKTIYKQIGFTSSMLLIFSLLALTISSCDKNKPIVDETRTFKDNNWNFENKFIIFEKQIEASEQPYEIYLDLDLENDLDIEEFPVTVSIYSDKGEESHKQITYYFVKSEDDQNKLPKGPKILTKLVYSEKYFNTSGHYTFKILRKSSKYDLYGIKNIRFRVQPKNVKS